jgi:adhesin HecA-like repeat protein
LQTGTISPGSAIANRGNLMAGQDLTLESDRLDLQGQLVAGRDLTLNAQSMVQIRDTIATPFLAQSGRDLTVQGNQGIDILALQHPQTPFQSGRNLSLISDGIISGDAHFASGGEFQVRSLSGQLANFTSLYDPIISSTGTVNIAAGYTGASLLIESQGSVRIQGAVTINTPDTVSSFVGSDAVLSSQPGLIIRSGQSNLVYGGNQTNSPTFTNGTVPTGITLDSPVRVQPNANGAIVKLTADNGGITFNSIDASSRTGGNGGSIELSAQGNITNTGSFPDPFGSSVGLGSFSYNTTGDSGNGGNISLTSTSGNITLINSALIAYSYSPSGSVGSGGNVALRTDSGLIKLENSLFDTSSQSDSGNAGIGGSISLKTGSGSITLADSALYSYSYSPSGDAESGGHISLRTSLGDIDLKNSPLFSYSQSAAGKAGNGGAITINASGSITAGSLNSEITGRDNSNGGSITLTSTNGSISLKDGAQISASTGGQGRGGDITLNAYDTVLVSDKSIVGSVAGRDSTGNGGNIEITAGSLEVSRGGYLTTSVFGKGTAGNVKLTVSGAAIFDGVALDPNRGSGFASSGIFNESRGGRSGDITIRADSLSIKDGAKVISSNIGQADAGNIFIDVTNAVSVSGLYKDGRPTRPEDDGSISSGIFSVKKSGGGNAGTINVTAGSLSVTDGAVLGVSLFDTGNAGNIVINVRDGVSFDGIGKPTRDGAVPLTSGAYSSVTQGAVGNGGDIVITASSLNVSNGAVLNSNTAGAGKAGNITLSIPVVEISGGGKILAATESSGNGGTITINSPTAVNLGTRNQDFSPVISVETSDAGKAGDIVINTPTLTLVDTARITATATATSTNSEGGGSITLNASRMNLAGIVGVFAETQGQTPAGTLRLNPYNNQPDLDISLMPNSQISASTSGSGRGGDLIAIAPQSITIAGPGKLAVETSSTGNAGNTTFTTRQLTLRDEVEVSASTSGSGRAGEITLNAESLALSGGAKVSTNTSSSGRAGDLTLNLSDRLTLTGSGTGLFASTTPGSTGNGGSIQIDPDRVLIQAGATIAVNSQGRGTGGNIFLQADRLELRDRGSITAETGSTQGGNITLEVSDLLLLRRNSTISATAGTAQAGGDGGNITINLPNGFIVGVKGENSDITANAFTGSGGRVNITAQGIYGLEFRPSLTPFSDITASSTFGVSGVVTLNTPNVDPNRGLVPLPVDLTDVSRLLVQNCPTGDALAKPPNEFIITGRGGLPPTPSEAMHRDAIQGTCK